MSKNKQSFETLTKRIETLEEKIALLSNNETKPTVKVDKPKKKPSGYNLFCKDMRQTAKEQLESELTGDQQLKPTDIMKRLGEMWKKLSDDERLEWNKKTL